MREQVDQHPQLIFSVGTQVVVLRAITGQGGRTLHPRGAVGVIAADSLHDLLVWLRLGEMNR